MLKGVISVEKVNLEVKADWHRKPVNFYDVKATELPTYLRGTTVGVKIELEKEEFEDLLNDLLKDRDWIEKYARETLLVTCKESPDKVLINPEGYSYARYVSNYFE